jgi:hypothetical protein
MPDQRNNPISIGRSLGAEAWPDVPGGPSISERAEWTEADCVNWCEECGDPLGVCEAMGGCDPEGVTYL